ncbi:nuclear transport factor 2 family protein [Fodinicola feengrottensis]|uniref:SnoaL-like domain-containing protein n=1 Tax=Fodinicola feengrottensis TaxID=435914 RepID=A0ABP4UIV5_9ACTN|nr:nuclear transport factor 2 family protein [Fodinicola feengrottensis]
MPTETDIKALVDSYAAVWNEGDPAARRKAIAHLWADDGVEVLPSGEIHGHQALETRIREAYEQFVAGGGFVFRVAADVMAHHDAVTFTTQMVPAGGGDIAWSGSIFLLLDENGRIRRDYQFAPIVHPAVRTVEEFLRRLAEGDLDGLAELFAPTVDWQLDWPAQGHPAVPWIRSRSTRADVIDHFRTLDAFHLPPKEKPAAPSILVDGNNVVVLGEIRQTVRATGRAYAARCAVHLTVEDGLITRYHVYEDSLTVAEALAAPR